MIDKTFAQACNSYTRFYIDPQCKLSSRWMHTDIFSFQQNALSHVKDIPSKVEHAPQPLWN